MDRVSRLLPVVALIGLGALIFFLRLHTYEEPLERDITTYAVIAHEMLEGKSLYSDLFDHKPPAIHVTYAVGELIAGRGRDAIFFLNVSAAIATMLACYFAASAAGGGRSGGFIAATFWVLASGDLALAGNQPNTEVFMNAFLTAGFCVFARAVTRGIAFRGAILAGVLFAAASLYKQIVIAQVLCLMLAYILTARNGTSRKAVVEFVILGAIGGIAWALVFSYFAVRGHLTALIESVFTYNRWYSGNVWQNLGQIATWPTVSADVLAVPLSIGTFSLAGVLLGLILGPRRPWILLLAFAFGTHVAVLLPGQSYPHYYQLWVPPLAIAAGWTFALLRRLLPAPWSALSYGAAGAACTILVMLEVPCYRLSPSSWSEKKYGRIFVETDRLANKIDRLLPPGAAFYEWGNESGFYFTSGRRPPSGIVFAFPTLAGPLAKKLAQRLVDDLERARPELIVVDSLTLAQTQRGHPVINWFEENYRLFSKTSLFSVKRTDYPRVIFGKDQFLLFVRKESKLASQRLEAKN